MPGAGRLKIIYTMHGWPKNNLYQTPKPSSAEKLQRISSKLFIPGLGELKIIYTKPGD